MPLNDELLDYGLPTRGDTLADQVYRQLSTAVLSGSVAPRERINIRRFAEDARVSVTPVREAVLRLVADGVLEITERNAVLVPERTEAEIEEIFDIRRTLEGEMAQTAAALLSDDDIQFLAETQQKFLNALNDADYRQVLHYNSIFHFTIYKRAGLPVRLKIVESLWLRIGPTLRYMYPILHRNRTDHRRHEDIIESASRRDPKALRSAVLEDLKSSLIALKQYVHEYADRNQRRSASRRG
jgi:DNA-binding GntR family transcriptional regulator